MIPKWFRRVAAVLSKISQRAWNTPALSTAAALASLASVPSNAKAQAKPAVPSAPRPADSPPNDTVRRYHEKYILTRSDSVVVRHDTTWYPKKRASGRALTEKEQQALTQSAPSFRGADTASASAPPARAVAPVAPRSTGAGHRSHASHASHSSHSSHRSASGWV